MKTAKTFAPDPRMKLDLVSLPLAKPTYGDLRNTWHEEEFLVYDQRFRQSLQREMLTKQYDGIDLASPSELIAHNRSDQKIASHIGAERVVFQELDALVDAVRSAAPPEYYARETQQFEVGVFNGKYVTPVPDGYFAHLERVRGESKKMKVIKSAREAVAKGSANVEDFQIAANGAEVADNGQVVPVSNADTEHDTPVVNGSDSPVPGVKRKRTGDELDEKPRRMMDISLHNQDDFEHED